MELGFWKNRPWRWRIGLILVICGVVSIFTCISDGSFTSKPINNMGRVVYWLSYFSPGIIGAVLMLTVKGKAKKIK